MSIDRVPALARILGLALGCAALPACVPATFTAPAPPGWQHRLASAEHTARGSAFPLPPAELEALMREPGLEIREVEAAGGGTMGALRVEAYFPAAQQELAFKWKRAPRGGDGWNNTPRREVAAYQIQKWFLEPEQFVVPTTVARCIPLDEYRRIDPDAEANLDGARCVLGALAVWLRDVEPTEVLLDEARFYRDSGYARSLAHYNLLTYLVANRDTAIGNMLVAADPEAPRVYSVDNSISFRREVFNFFQVHWNTIRVPALPREAIDRLREVTMGEIESLAVVAQLRLDEDGCFRESEPTAPFDRNEGVRRRPGVLQLGLEPGEIEGVRTRLGELIEAVDAGEIALF